MGDTRAYLPVGTHTPEQEAQLERYYQAAKILRAAGFGDARVIQLCVFDPKDTVAAIQLEPRP